MTQELNDTSQSPRTAQPVTQSNEGASTTERSLIFEYVKEIGAQERHFNRLCGTYKAMASTWLLSTFAGVGYVLSSIGRDYLLCAAIGIAGSVGVFLLFMIDMKVYQHMIAANFREGKRLEDKHEWLPRIRTSMVTEQPPGTFRSYLSWFYIIGVLFPLAIGVCSLSLHSAATISILLPLVSCPFMAGILLFVFNAMVPEKGEEHLLELLARVHKPLGSRKVFRVWFVAAMTTVFMVVHLQLLVFPQNGVAQGTSERAGAESKQQDNHNSGDGTEAIELQESDEGARRKGGADIEHDDVELDRPEAAQLNHAGV